MSFFEQIIQALAFPFKDPQWARKVGIGFLLGLGNFIIPFVPTLILSGYCYKIMRRIIVENGEPYLPEWEDWGTLLSDGVKLWGASMIYGLPVLVLGLTSAAAFMLPAFIFPFMIDQGGRLPPDSGLFVFAGTAVGFAILCLVFPLGLATSLLRAPAIGHLAAKGEFSAAFRIRETWPILKAGISGFLITILATMLVTWVVTMAMQMIVFTFILAFLYPLLLGLYVFLVMVYTYTFEAFAYREGVKKLAGA